MARFIVIMLGIVIGANWYLWWAGSLLFGIVGFRQKAVFAAVLAVLFLSLVGAMFLSRGGDSGSVRIFYLAVMALQAVFWQLVLWFAVALPLWAILRAFGVGVRPQAFGWAAVILVLVMSLYGIWNARYGLTVSHIELPLTDRPATLVGKKIVQISDVHVGLVNGAEYVRKVTELANAENPDYVFVTGDLLDSSGDGVGESLEEFRGLRAKEGVFAVLGNHDTYHGRDEAISLMRGLGWRVLIDEKVELGDGLTVVGMDYPERLVRQDTAAILKNILGGTEQKNDSGLTVLLRHEPIGLKEAEAAGIGLMLSGHTHKGQIWPFRVFTWLVYRGYDAGLYRFGKLTLYVNSATGTWGPYMKSSARPEITSLIIK